MQLDVTGGQSCGAVAADDNIVWGTAIVDGSDEASCAEIADDNIVWGTVAQNDNIIWGTFASDDNIVWGTATVSDDNIVWGTGVAAELDEY